MKRKLKLNIKSRVPFLLTLALVVAVGLLLISYLGWKEKKDTEKRDSEFSAHIADMGRQIEEIKQRKIEEARKLEEEARKKAEEEAKKAEAEAQKVTATVPASVTSNPNCTVNNPGSITVVINKKNCFSPIDWAPALFEMVGPFYLRPEAASNYIAMRDAAAAQGIVLDISSAYRSYAGQVGTYNHWVSVNGVAGADTVSARPGYSEHQTGLVVDLKTTEGALENFTGSAAHNWLRANAANYGFIERYMPGMTSITGYAAESWHWRYVGTAVAQDMKAKGITTMETYFGVPGGDY